MWILNTAICNEQNNEVVPQVEHMGPGYAWDAADSVTRIIDNRPLTIPPSMHAFHLDAATTPTDVVSQGYIYATGLLVSEAFYDVLRGFTVQPHETALAEVVYHGESFNYVWVHMTELVEDRIDFATSDFAVRTAEGREQGVSLSSHDELRDKCRELVNTIGPSRLVPRRLIVRHAPRYDLFAILLTELVFFTSDLLAAELARNQFTGFELQPTSAVVSFE